MPEKVFTGHWSGVTGRARFWLSSPHRVEQVCVQSVVPGSQPPNNDLVTSGQLVVLAALMFLAANKFPRLVNLLRNI